MTIKLHANCIPLRSRGTAHDPTNEPGVVPMGQIIPSIGPMVADRQRRVMNARGGMPEFSFRWNFNFWLDVPSAIAERTLDGAREKCGH